MELNRKSIDHASQKEDLDVEERGGTCPERKREYRSRRIL